MFESDDRDLVRRCFECSSAVVNVHSSFDFRELCFCWDGSALDERLKELEEISVDLIECVVRDVGVRAVMGLSEELTVCLVPVMVQDLVDYHV